MKLSNRTKLPLHPQSPLKFARLLAVISVMSAMGSACGGVAYREVPGSETTPSSSSGGSTDSGSDPYTDTSGDETSSDSENTYSISTSFKIAGPGASSGSSYTRSGISTDSLLKVTVSGGQPTTIAAGGMTAQYSCMRVTVTVGSDTQEAFVTNTGSAGTGTCQGAVASQTLDFSHTLTPGHGTVSVKVSEAQYDNCSNQYSELCSWGNMYCYYPYSFNIAASGCALHNVYSVNGAASHYVQGKLTIQVNTP